MEHLDSRCDYVRVDKRKARGEDMPMDTNTTPSNFIRSIIEEDLASGKVKKVVTRFPPEPNGYLHIGHAKSCLLYTSRCV